MRKRILVSVTSDLVTDQRVDRAASTLKEAGYDVLVIGRKRLNSLELNSRRYRTHRFRLWFEKGPLFYITYNIRLFFFLMGRHADILLSNDLDTLLPNFLVSRIRKIPLVYDSHEYFTAVPELMNRHRTRNIWLKIEKLTVPHLKYAYTVNDSIAKIYTEKYGVPFKVIRNLPAVLLFENETKIEARQKLGLPLDKSIFILQGAGININRGAEEAVEAMRYLNNSLLLIIGGGDVFDDLKILVNKTGLNDKVQFTGKLPYPELMRFTRASDVGLSLDKDISLNYRYSLPNKIFDYIQAGIPVLASSLPEVQKVIKQYEAGEIIIDHKPETIAAALHKMISDTTASELRKAKLDIAAKELNWDHEKLKLLEIFRNIE